MRLASAIRPLFAPFLFLWLRYSAAPFLWTRHIRLLRHPSSSSALHLSCHSHYSRLVVRCPPLSMLSSSLACDVVTEAKINTPPIKPSSNPNTASMEIKTILSFLCLFILFVPGKLQWIYRYNASIKKKEGCRLPLLKLYRSWSLILSNPFD